VSFSVLSLSHLPYGQSGMVEAGPSTAREKREEYNAHTQSQNSETCEAIHFFDFILEKPNTRPRDRCGTERLLYPFVTGFPGSSRVSALAPYSSGGRVGSTLPTPHAGGDLGYFVGECSSPQTDAPSVHVVRTKTWVIDERDSHTSFQSELAMRSFSAGVPRSTVRGSAEGTCVVVPEPREGSRKVEFACVSP
jgi:hypothetical protein